MTLLRWFFTYLVLPYILAYTTFYTMMKAWHKYQETEYNYEIVGKFEFQDGILKKAINPKELKLKMSDRYLNDSFGRINTVSDMPSIKLYLAYPSMKPYYRGIYKRAKGSEVEMTIVPLFDRKYQVGRPYCEYFTCYAQFIFKEDFVITFNYSRMFAERDEVEKSIIEFLRAKEVN